MPPSRGEPIYRLVRRTLLQVQQAQPGPQKIATSHGVGAALRHVQAELSTVERPDLAVLVDAKDQRLVRRIKVEPDQSVTLAAKFLSRETFKVSTSCGLRPCAHQIRRTLL